MSLDDDARDELARLEAAHRRRHPRVVDGRPGPRIMVDGRAVLGLSSNDYLGLAGDLRLARAAAAATEQDGVGSTASRLIVGNHRRHVALEAKISAWMERDGVRLFNSGYAANTGILPALVGRGDVVFSDELNHASIVDGCRLSGAEIVIVPHRDLGALERALATRMGRRRVVVSETLFSMDGTIADVGALAALCRKHAAALVLDEAHAIGARGPAGRGVAAEAGVVADVVVGTCGKALGAFGAFAATTNAIAELLWNRARTLVFATALPPMVCAAVEVAIDIASGREGDDRRRVLAAHARRLRQAVNATSGDATSAIVPIVVGDDERVMRISAEILERGVFVQGIRPPTVPEGSARLRVSLSASLSAEDVETAGEIIDDAVRRST